jgi:hypothetical protein
MDQKIVDSIQEEDKEENEPIPSHSETFSCVEIAMKLCKKQDECNAAQLLTHKRPSFTPIQNYRQIIVLCLLIFTFSDSRREDIKVLD